MNIDRDELWPYYFVSDCEDYELFTDSVIAENIFFAVQEKFEQLFDLQYRKPPSFISDLA